MTDLAPRFLRDRRGSTALIFALAVPVLLVTIGAAIDYSNASLARTRLNAIADSAALAALSPTLMNSPVSAGQTAATSTFNSQLATVANVVPNSGKVTVTETGTNSRSVTVKYSAQVQNFFMGMIGQPTTTIGGTAVASAAVPANIDFYLLLDNSPSMSLPATAAGLAQMINLTSAQGGCAFACHQASTGNSDTAGNPYYNPDNLNQNCTGQGNSTTNGCIQMDNYALARANNITLRLDELSAAVGDLLSAASGKQTGPTPPTYRFSINSMDSQFAIGLTNLVALTTNYVSSWTNASPNFSVMEMYANDVSCVTSIVNGALACTSGGSVNDVSTNYDDALSKMNAMLPVAGHGTNEVGDTPQEVLFFVTDGVEDESSNGSRLIQAINAGSAHNYCNDIKAKGVKIAILYTDYLPIPNNSFYVNNVQPFQPDIGAALQACASPGLFLDAGLTGDLRSALLALFGSVMAQTARLTN